jgi:hypothetical protein
MDFGIGYRWRAHESNLLLSVRTSPDEPLADATSSTEPPPAAPPRPKKPRPPAPVGPQRGGFFWFGR